MRLLGPKNIGQNYTWLTYNILYIITFWIDLLRPIVLERIITHAILIKP